MRRLKIQAATVAAGLLLTACGGANRNDAATTTKLRADLTAVATAAAGKNYRAAATALAQLNADAVAARNGGKLSDAQLARIRTAATAVQADLATAIKSTATPTAPSAAPTPTVTPKPTKSKHQGGDGNAKSNGNGDGQGGGGD